MSDVIVRPYRHDDEEPAAEAVFAAYAALPKPLSEPYASELRSVATRAREAEVLVAEVDGRVVGCSTFVPSHDNPWAEDLRPGEVAIRMLGVHPSAQGRGAGEALVVASIERARGTDAPHLFLHSTPWMTAAHRLYERLGFVRLPDRDFSPVPEVPLLAFAFPLRR